VNCEAARGIIQDYLERRLAILDRNEFVRHVNECRACEEELAGYRDVFSYLGGMKPLSPPPGFQNAVISQLKSEGYVHEPKLSAVGRGLAGIRRQIHQLTPGGPQASLHSLQPLLVYVEPCVHLIHQLLQPLRPGLQGLEQPRIHQRDGGIVGQRLQHRLVSVRE